MPVYVIQGLDRPGGAALRAAHRDAHRAHLAAAGSALKLAGPLEDEAGTVIGSLILIDVPDRAAADAFVAADPFFGIGLFERFEVKRWRISYGALG